MCVRAEGIPTQVSNSGTASGSPNKHIGNYLEWNHWFYGNDRVNFMGNSQIILWCFPLTLHCNEWEFLGMAKPQNPNAREDAEHKNARSLLVEIKMVHSLWKTTWHFLTKLNIILPYVPAITLVGINQKM